jgi:RimK family alpha-L-glutamate ligase
MSRIAVVGFAHRTNCELVQAWRKGGIEAQLVMPADAVVELSADDVALGRLDVVQTLDGVEPGLQTLDWLELKGVTVLNPSQTLLATHDKLRTEARLAAAGLPRPPAWHVQTAGELRRLPLPIVVKPRFGSWGRDVFRCRTAAELDDCLGAILMRDWFHKDGAFAQKLLPPSGFDLRLIVAGGEVVGAAERVACPGEWRTNVSLGGTLREARVTGEARALAAEAAVALGGDLVGVDLMPVGRGLTVLEVNGAVEFDGRYSLPGTNVYTGAARALGFAPALALGAR